MKKAEQTREYIIERTAPVFNTKGYAGTSLTDMTEATGLTKGSIYGNFDNKDEVALAAFDFNLRKVNNVVRAALEKHSTAREQLLAYVKVYQDFASHPFPNGGCPVLNTSTECDDTHPALKKKAAAAIESWKKMLTDLIQQGIAEKSFRKNIHVEQTALTIIAMIEGATMISRVTGKNQYRSLIMDSVKTLLESLE
ncbi:MAG: TetR/AcrR family transcriptional regulator [Agriterribacter sp.]